ncbi:MAG: hypothetical protein CME85_11355 [Henriciella sp.]|jgi:hypothetical protein|uniref:pilus assembly protein TadG-related protein n=1 Tax=Henriciella sp. TaxID=1968823 RepID=UPI000C115150|nr:pilus assembly protein TadG-related protein [Henriciella sp.]MAN74171.1 hypothetical protein [Henriciella sp.]MBK76075.1 hypothetical protein [Henriciella sp.]PHR76148.1 MAG: hypothetical protein COA64_11175 [Henriciella sp.]|tara:strand:+ start:1164 stop:2663 length:1500 start_codon:yes stop_codon:yes gene_type:complete
MRSSRASQFLRHRKGNVAVIWAFALLPIFAVIGLTIDTQLAFGKKERVQYAADSAVLAGARMLQSSNSKTQAIAHARDYFNALIADRSGLHCETLEVTYPGDDEIAASSSCYQDTTLSQIFGRARLDFNIVSTATYGVGKLDVSFVFDISGSMGDYGRLHDLKAAAKDAVTTLLPAPGSSSDGDVRIAMVAYNDVIDAGKYFESVTGLKKRRYYSTDRTVTTTKKVEEEVCAPEPTCDFWFFGRCWKWVRDCKWVEKDVTTTTTVTYTSLPIDSTCVYEREGTYKFEDEQPTQLITPDLVNTLQEGQRRASTDANNSDGYMTAKAHATFDEGSKLWTPKDTNCNAKEPFELSHNHTQIDHYIDSLRDGGGTAGHQGIAWGWYLISPKWGDIFDHNAKPLPYDEPDTTKAMIIMTDGEFNRQYHSGQGSSAAQAKALCDKIKEEDVVIFTVAFQAPEDGAEVLAYCATSEEHAFKASNGAELQASYQSIATSISDLRIKS